VSGASVLTLNRLTLVLYLATLALLPWSWFPPFPWLHEHAQWSDVLFAATVLAWAAECRRSRRWPSVRPAHVAAAGYLLAASLSLLFATGDRATGAWKLLGMSELVLLAVITTDIAGWPGSPPVIARVVAITSLLTAVAGIVGLLLFYSGSVTPLIGPYGDLAPSRWYARVQAGLYHPNLLGSYCIFAAAVVAQRDAGLPRHWRRVTLGALWLTVLLTFGRAILGFVLAAAVRRADTPARRAVAGACAVAGVGILIALTLWDLRLDPTRPFQARITAAMTPRYATLTSSLASIAVRPLWGTGPGSSPGRLVGFPMDAHVTLVNIAGTLGLPALIAFITMLVLLWRGQGRSRDRTIWGGLAGMALDSLAGDIEDYRHLWVLLGLAAAHAPSPRERPDSGRVSP
jgi:hypothetical protein